MPTGRPHERQFEGTWQHGSQMDGRRPFAGTESGLQADSSPLA